MVISEPHRAFYGNQFSLTFPLFEHYGVQLWVPEVGGAVDPASEAHDLVMSVFGGMSKGERNRIKIRVRSAMQAQTKVEGRYLGGRPPYGYRLVDAGPHPNPAKAADGKRLHVLELDPVTAPVVARIFRDYLNGVGIWALAERLTAEGIPCPSAHDPGRNRHRSGIAWSKGAIRAILLNPRYTGYQVWNKQRKAETLLDVEDVALGYETRLRWNDTSTWVWSDRIAHPPIIDEDTFEQVGRRLASRDRPPPAGPWSGPLRQPVRPSDGRRPTAYPHRPGAGPGRMPRRARSEAADRKRHTQWRPMRGRRRNRCLRPRYRCCPTAWCPLSQVAPMAAQWPGRRQMAAGHCNDGPGSGHWPTGVPAAPCPPGPS